MAKIFKTEHVTNGIRYIVRFHLENAKSAEFCEACYLMSVRMISRVADLYVKGNVLCLDTPNKNLTEYIEPLLKNEIGKLNYIY
nr:hypothetical protein [uncultured Blautia sp.]